MKKQKYDREIKNTIWIVEEIIVLPSGRIVALFECMFLTRREARDYFKECKEANPIDHKYVISKWKWDCCVH